MYACSRLACGVHGDRARSGGAGKADGPERGRGVVFVTWRTGCKYHERDRLPGSQSADDGGTTPRHTCESRLGRWSPPPRVVLCAGAGEGKGTPQGASSGTPHDPLPGFRSHVAPESAVGHPRSWSTAARLPPRSRRLWASVFLPVLRSYGRDFAVLAVPLVKELIAEAVIMQLGHSAPTARSTSTSRRQDVQA